ncbi:MAG: hypothetical protein VX610_05770 [SAR324 cluster bacterium]|nr:hypothetical protein [SAR324 cluster bacterium]
MRRTLGLLILICTTASSLWAVPAAPNLFTFEQPDGSTFQGYLRGDEYFSWVETKHGSVVVENRATRTFEFAVVRQEANGRSVLAPSGVSATYPGRSGARQADAQVPNISQDTLSKLWDDARTAALNRPLLVSP